MGLYITEQSKLYSKKLDSGVHAVDPKTSAEPPTKLSLPLVSPQTPPRNLQEPGVLILPCLHPGSVPLEVYSLLSISFQERD